MLVCPAFREIPPKTLQTLSVPNRFSKKSWWACSRLWSESSLDSIERLNEACLLRVHLPIHQLASSFHVFVQGMAWLGDVFSWFLFALWVQYVDSHCCPCLKFVHLAASTFTSLSNPTATNELGRAPDNPWGPAPSLRDSSR